MTAARLGWKAGLGAPQAMAALGTAAPLCAPLTTATLLPDGAEQAIGRWTRPVLEPELAVRLGPGGAIAALAPAIELIDLHEPPRDVAAILAHGIYHRAVLLGPFTPGAEPEGLTIDVQRNGAPEVAGADALALTGHPRAVLDSLDAAYEPGDVVITGAAVAPLEIAPGDEVVVRVAGLGAVGVRLI